MSLCNDCVTKTVWEGEAEGKDTKFGNTDVYIAEPKGGDKSKVVLFLTDIFGLGLNNNKLLADDYARAGFYTVVPDLFAGDLLTDEMKDAPGFDLMGHVKKHVGKREERVDPIIAKLKEDGAKEIAAIGFCFGARYVFDYAFDKTIWVGAVSHPSLLQVPEDLEKLKTSGTPMLFNTCENDFMFGPDAQAKADSVLGNGSAEGTGYKRTYYPGCTHGFAVRGDKSDPKVKFGKEDSFKQSVDWLKKHGF